jgi:hypothetical protein
MLSQLSLSVPQKKKDYSIKLCDRGTYTGLYLALVSNLFIKSALCYSDLKPSWSECIRAAVKYFEEGDMFRA